MYTNSRLPQADEHSTVSCAALDVVHGEMAFEGMLVVPPACILPVLCDAIILCYMQCT